MGITLTNRYSEKIQLVCIFIFCYLTRILFKVLSGYNNFDLFPDSYRYDRLSSAILRGDDNMDIVAYLTAPLYPYLLSVLKFIFGAHWETATVMFQFTLVSLSSVFIYKISELLFRDNRISLLAAITYILYPLTLWYNFTFTQETTFQCLFIFFSYYYLSSLRSNKIQTAILSGFLFALAFLTKSHIIILWPFLLLLYFLKGQWKYGIVFSITALLMTIPHGLKNKKDHDVYTLSSHGNASLFLLGHSDETYDCLMQRAGDMGEFSAEGCNPDFVFNKEHEFPIYGKVNQLSVSQRNSTRMEIALSWIKANPKKFLDLKFFGIKRFVLPGLDWRQYKLIYWLPALIIGLLVYLPAYWILGKKLLGKESYDHLFITAVIIISAAIFIVFFPINRFRVITMDPLMCIYAAAGYMKIYKKLTR